MLIEEARWFGTHIAGLPVNSLFPMLNVGSSTESFRTVKQPWIDEHIFRPARKRDGRVIHLDIKQAPGIELVGDLGDPTFQRRLDTLELRSVFCSNLLEHVSDRKRICETLVSLLPSGGYALLSCPHQYPRHDDPIDNGFRPSVGDLEALVPGMETVEAAIVGGGTYWDALDRSPRRLARELVRACLPMYATGRWMNAVRHLAWLNRPFSATCLLAQKR